MHGQEEKKEKSSFWQTRGTFYIILSFSRSPYLSIYLRVWLSGCLSVCSIFHLFGLFLQRLFSPLLLRGAPDTARILCRSFTPKRLRQLQVKDLSKVSALRLERDSNPRPLGRRALYLPMSHKAPQCCCGAKQLAIFVCFYFKSLFTPRCLLLQLNGLQVVHCTIKKS